MALKLVYFDIRGLGESIRLALQDQGIDYEEVLFPNGASSEWKTYKATAVEDGSIPFGQCPQLIDGDSSIVQSKSILRHLGRTRALYGQDEKEHSNVDMIIDANSDARMHYAKLAYSDRFAEAETSKFASAMKGGFIVDLERWFAKRRPADAEWIAASTITIADYEAYDVLNNMLRVVPDLFDAAPKVKAWYTRVESRPLLNKYISSNPSWRQKVNGNGLG